MICFCFPVICASQPVFFEKTFGTSADDWTRGVKEFPDGFIYTAGYTLGGPLGGTDVCLTKLNKHGNVVWSKYYGDSLDNYCFALEIAADGTLMLAGETETSLFQQDGILMKIDSAGNEIWTRFYSSSVTESVKSFCTLNDGGFALAGFINDTSGYNNVWLLRTDSLGFEIWQRSWGGINNEYATGVKQTAEGDIIIAADTKSYGAGGYDAQLIKADTSGNMIWNYTYGDSLENGSQGVCVTGNKYILYGETENSQFSPFDFLIQQTDTAGIDEGEDLLGGMYADAVFSLIQTSNAHFVFTGYSGSYSNGNNNLVVMRIDSSVNIIWTKNFGGPGIDIGYEIIPSILGGYIICGTYTDSITNTIDNYLIHVDESGEFSRVAENVDSEMRAYPNPANEKLFIQNDRQDCSLELININGTTVLRKQIKGNMELDITSFPAGMYILKLEYEDKIISRKIIIN